MAYTDEEKEELSILKKRASKIGIKFPNNIKLETLRDKVNGALDGEEDVEELEPEEIVKKATKKQEQKKQGLGAMQLYAVTVNPNSDHYKNRKGVKADITNKNLGIEINRFIPFDIETLAEDAAIEWLKGAMYQRIIKKKNELTGKTVDVSVMSKSFVVDKRELTDEEKQDLKIK